MVYEACAAQLLELLIYGAHAGQRARQAKQMRIWQRARQAQQMRIWQWTRQASLPRILKKSRRPRVGICVSCSTTATASEPPKRHLKLHRPVSCTHT